MTSLASTHHDDRIRAELISRLRQLRDVGRCRDILTAAGLQSCVGEELQTIRITDVARAVYIAEFACEYGLSALSIETVLTPDYARRNRAFEGVETEMTEEDSWMRRLVGGRR